MLPAVLDCAADFGVAGADLLGAEIPILGVGRGSASGDRRAGVFSGRYVEIDLRDGGVFALLNTGDTLVTSQNRLLGTIAYQFDGVPTYALEGSIFVAGAVVQWLRDGLKIIADATETQPLAESSDTGQDVVLVPAFTGLGAPYWRPDCRGAVYGLTRNSGPAEFARAALESVGYQTRDLLEAMQADWQRDETTAAPVLRVDGGMSASDWAMQFLSDIIDAPVDRPEVLETTALGAAWLAGMRAGIYPDQTGFAETWALERRFEPEMDQATRAEKYDRWGRAVQATLGV